MYLRGLGPLLIGHHVDRWDEWCDRMNRVKRQGSVVCAILLVNFVATQVVAHVPRAIDRSNRASTAAHILQSAAHH